MQTKVVFLAAFALLVSCAAASGAGRSLLQNPGAVVQTRASATAVSSSSDGGKATAVSVSKAENGADVSTESVAVAKDGAEAKAVTVAEGEGDVTIDRKTVVSAAGDTAKATVAVFVKKVEDGVDFETIQTELFSELEKAEPVVLVKTIAVGLLEKGDYAGITVNATEALLEERGCEEFRKPFIGFSLPIARIEGGCGPVVNECIFDLCPEECCTPEAQLLDTCGCSEDICPWAKGFFSKPEYVPFFWKCRDCELPVDSCICPP